MTTYTFTISGMVSQRLVTQPLTPGGYLPNALAEATRRPAEIFYIARQDLGFFSLSSGRPPWVKVGGVPLPSLLRLVQRFASGLYGVGSIARISGESWHRTILLSGRPAGPLACLAGQAGAENRSPRRDCDARCPTGGADHCPGCHRRQQAVAELL